MLGYGVPNTSVHFPAPLLEQLNRIAGERGVSRNALIIESCRRLIEERSAWPEGLFENDHLTSGELAELRAGERKFLVAIRKARKSRRHGPF
jgi:hypothetical protein